ncbi:TonB-dependent receptor domain-containing protein [Vaginella massiliensis]|uniref:TonB-dependent receptor domain-containing protein n=1 Tax=Vaginella massiliensis TaxID=1816680 RepID=UPI003753D3EE
MKIRKLSLVVLFSLLSYSTFAQETAKISGRVLNEQNENLALVNVVLFHPTTNEFVAEVNSDEQGYFVVEDVADGTYKIQIIEFGYQPYEQLVEVKDGQLNMGEIRLKTENSPAIELKGAFIRAQVSTYRTDLDKRVVEVGNDLVSAGTDAAAILNNIPSVNVDQQTGAVSLRGNENVRVYVDGKPSSLSADQLLKQIPSNQIQRVEIITNPSAKYEADGKSGIINIILIKQRNKGYNVGLNTGVEYGRKLRYTNSVNANINVGDFNLFGNYNYNHRPTIHHGEMVNYTRNEVQDFEIKNKAKNISYKLGFDWFINDKTALTIYTNQYNNNWSGSFDYDILRAGNKYFNTSKINSDFDAQDYSLNFKRDFNKDDHSLTLDAFYSKANTPDKRLMTDEYPVLISYFENRFDETSNTRVNLDYVNQIIDGGKIEAGIQFRQEQKDNVFDSNKTIYDANGNVIVDTNGNPIYQGASFDFTRNFYSAYVNYKQKFDKFGFQVGVRAEQTEDDVNYTITPDDAGNYKRDYLDFFPSAYVTYDMTPKTQLMLNYSRRITRPGIYQLTPVPQWSSPMMSNQGNPNLLPEYTDAYEFGLQQQLAKGGLNFNAFYRHTTDNIMFSSQENPDVPGQIIQTSENYDKTDEYGLEVSFNYRWAKWFSMFLAGDWTSMNFFNTNMQTLQNEEMRTNRFTGRMSNTFTVSPNFSIQNFAFYQGPFENFQGKMKEMWRMDLGVRYTFMDGKASVNARMNDLFKTMKASFDMVRPYDATGFFQWESRTYYLGFQYNFGGKVRTRREVQQNQTQSGGGISLQ